MGPELNAMQTFKKSYALAEGCDRLLDAGLGLTPTSMQ
jgi:hypothetical protein